MEIYLIENGLWNIYEKALRHVDYDPLEKWKVGDSKDMDLVLVGLSNTQIHLTDFPNTSKGVWDTIEMLFGCKAQNVKL